MNDKQLTTEKDQNYWLKKLLKVLLIVIIVIILFFISSFIYVYTHQDIIKDKAVEYVNKHIKVPLHVNTIKLNLFSHFPQVSVRFTEVEICEKELLSLSYLDLSINIWDIIRGKYNIKKIYLYQGNISLKVMEDGSNNFDIFVKDTTTKASPILLEFPNISLNDIHLSYHSLKDQFYIGATINKMLTKGEYKKEVFNETSSIKLVLDSLIIGSDFCIRQPININLSTNSSIDFKNSIFNANKISANINGIDLLLALNLNFNKKNPTIHSDINIKKTLLSNIITILPENFQENLNKFKLKGTLGLSAQIKGSLAKEKNPKLDALITLNNAEITNENFNFSNINLIANINSKKLFDLSVYNVEINNLKAKYGRNSNLEGKAKIYNLIAPQIDIAVNGILNVEEFKFINSESINLIIGSVQYKINGSANIPNWNVGYKSILALAHLNAKFDLQTVDFFSSSYNFNNVNATIIINDDSLILNPLNCNINHQQIQNANAIIVKWKNLLLSTQPQLIINLKANIPSMVLDSLINTSSPQKAKTTKDKSKVKPTILANADININNFLYKTWVAKNVKINSEIESRSKHVKININSDLIRHKLFTAGDLKINGRMISDKFIIDNIDFKAFSGNINGSGYVVLSDKQNEFVIDLIAKQININQLFREMENFNQTLVTNKNIKGIADIDLQARGSTTKDWKLIKPSIKATANVNIKNGELINFEPLIGLNKFIKRDFSYIKFGELKNTFYLSDQIIEIPQMYILSNVINIKVSGSHTLDNEIDYHLAVKARELLHHSATQINYIDDYGYINYDDDRGMTLYVRIHGKPGNYKYSLFDKEQRKQSREETFKIEQQSIKTNIKEEMHLFEKDTSLFIIKPGDEKAKTFKYDWIPADTINETKTKTIEKPKKKFTFDWD